MMAYLTYSAGTSLAFAEQSLWLSSLPQIFRAVVNAEVSESSGWSF